MELRSLLRSFIKKKKKSVFLFRKKVFFYCKKTLFFKGEPRAPGSRGPADPFGPERQWRSVWSCGVLQSIQPAAFIAQPEFLAILAILPMAAACCA
jgi:hypothetical protein